MNDPNAEQILSSGNAETSPDLRLQGAITPLKSWSGTTGTSNGERGTDEAVGDMIAARLNSLLQDCIQEVTSAKELVLPSIFEIKGSSNEITERLRHSRKQALLCKDELEAERQKIHEASCKVIDVLNDTMAVIESLEASSSSVPMQGLYNP